MLIGCSVFKQVSPRRNKLPAFARLDYIVLIRKYCHSQLDWHASKSIRRINQSESLTYVRYSDGEARDGPRRPLADGQGVGTDDAEIDLLELCRIRVKDIRSVFETRGKSTAGSALRETQFRRGRDRIPPVQSLRSALRNRRSSNRTNFLLFAESVTT